MRLFYLACISLVLLPTHASSSGRWRAFSATAYSIHGETADGSRTVEGRTLAADPRILPFGTQVEIRNAGEYSGQYTVQDAGRKIKGRKIDLFLRDPEEAKKFGKQRVHVKVVRKASP